MEKIRRESKKRSFRRFEKKERTRGYPRGSTTTLPLGVVGHWSDFFEPKFISSQVNTHFSIFERIERFFHRETMPGQGQSPSICMPTRRVDIQIRCLQFTVWRIFELLRTCQNRIFDFGMFVETGSDLEPQATYLYPKSGCPGLQIRDSVRTWRGSQSHGEPF